MYYTQCMGSGDIKQLFTEKGEVLMSIIVYGAKTFSEIESMMIETGKPIWVDLNILLNDLIIEGDIFLNEKD